MKPTALREILHELRLAGVTEFSGMGLRVRFGAPNQDAPEDLSTLTPEQREDRRISAAEAKRKHDQQLENWSVG